MNYELIHEKLKLLYELGHIGKRDRRIRDIQIHLSRKNAIQIDNWVHDIIVGNKTVDEALYGRGVI
mgnify:CR=1 FL=1